MTINIIKYSHNFALVDPHPVYHQHIKNYVDANLTHISHHKLWNSQVVSQVSKIFAVRKLMPLEYRFHISCLDQFIEYFTTRGMTQFNITEVPMYEPASCEFNMITDKVPWGEQPELIEYLVSDGKKKVIELQAGQGKAVRNGTPVRTINGWTNIEDLKIGDKVMGETGEFHNVTGVYPQGLKDLYRFTFRDGRTIDACKEHLWHVKYCPKGTGFETRNGVLSTSDLLEYQGKLKSGLSRFYIPLINNNIIEPDVDLPVNPYLLGVLLGDGYIGDSVITISKPINELHVLIAEIMDKDGIVYNTKIHRRKTLSLDKETRDSEVITTRINRYASPANQTFFDKLETMGLLNNRSDTKFIPALYITAGTAQRLELLRGLLDTDGHPKMHGGIEVGFVSEQLANQTRELLFSVGCTATIHLKKPMYIYNGERRTGKDFYRMSVRTRNASELFKIKTKRDKAFVKTQYSDDLHLRIERIEKLPEQDYATCISVDNPTKLFVTKDYLVTHNTFVTLNALSMIKQRAMLIIKPMYIQRWLDDLTKDTGIYKLTPEECVVISGSRELCNVIMQAQAGELNYKFIIMSNRTLANYYKDYRFGVNMEKYAGLSPHMLMETLGIGVKIIDEAHQDFHACYVSDLFTHVPKSIELSATLTPDDEFLRRMYENVYPRELRYGGGVYKKYVDVVAVPYRIDRDVKAQIKYAQRGRTSYSHGALEESLMKSKKRMMSFLGMVTDLTHRYFITERVPGYKLLIFASRIEMCKIIADHLKSIYPEYKITKYTQEEDYSVLEDIDIIVSTPMSAGTAVDISRLQVAITTVSIGATQLNLQMLGRLRELRGVEKKPMFVYLYCTDIPKHVEYHEKKMNQTFKNKVNSYQVLHPPIYYV